MGDVVSIEINPKFTNKNVVEFCKVLKDMANLYARKNNDYGNSFDKGMDELGIIYGICRMYDKMNRIVNLAVKSHEQLVRDETILDTVIDLANYSVMAIAYWNKVDSEVMSAINDERDTSLD